MVAQSVKALPTKGAWQQSYALFSRAPLTSATEQTISELGIIYRSVDEIEAEMHAWQTEA